MAPKEHDPESVTSIAYRLKVTRLALGYTQAFIANLIGAQGHTTWNNYEKGIRRIDIDHALRLCAVTGVTLEWIYRGNISALSPKLTDAIRKQLEKDVPPKR